MPSRASAPRRRPRSPPASASFVRAVFPQRRGRSWLISYPTDCNVRRFVPGYFAHSSCTLYIFTPYRSPECTSTSYSRLRISFSPIDHSSPPRPRSSSPPPNPPPHRSMADRQDPSSALRQNHGSGRREFRSGQPWSSDRCAASPPRSGHESHSVVKFLYENVLQNVCKKSRNLNFCYNVDNWGSCMELQKMYCMNYV